VRWVRLLDERVWLLVLNSLSPGHCYLMQDELQQAYQAYQQALYLLPNPKVRATQLFTMDASHRR
jgi:Tfp pilus assembly protein PilF